MTDRGMIHRRAPDTRHFLGVDIGKERDPSAIVNLTRHTTYTGKMAGADWHPEVDRDELACRFAELLPLGTRYIDVVARVLEVARKLALGEGGAPAGDVVIVPDATGVGAAVVEMLLAGAGEVGLKMHWTPEHYWRSVEAGPARKRVSVVPVVMTGGADAHEKQSGVVLVPKHDLMVGAAVSFERADVVIPRSLKLADRIKLELASVKSTYTPSGKPRYVVDGSDHHADLVMAFALALWASQRKGRATVGEQPGNLLGFGRGEEVRREAERLARLGDPSLLRQLRR